MKKEKLTVVWICHFSNGEVRKLLPLVKKAVNTSDFAPWITNLIHEFKQFKDIDLHVIAPHIGLKMFSSSFDIDGIHYHFFKADIPFLNRYWPHFFRLDAWTGFALNRLLVRRFINKIQPDIINLIGAENAYYSVTVSGIRHIPILISIQGIYSNEERFKVEKRDKVRCRVERKIHAENRYYGISAPFMPDLIRRDALDPILFWNRFPLKIVKLEDVQHIEKKYDFVFFSRMIPLKGTEDALEALALVKQHKPGVSLRMMGYGDDAYLAELLEKARRLGIEKNVEISGGFVLHEDLLNEASKAKYYLLPTKLDTIPGTIFEAIYLGLPVVSYLTGDIPLLNKGDTRVLLCDKEDISALADNMIRLLDEPALGVELSQKAKLFVEKYFDNKKIAFNFVRQYNAVLAHYHNNEPVPDALLYENYLADI
ncbi:MAG: glycosyltransferase family 4 protein [Chlorobium sp.]|nr:glycosyltransferase family 4 protein [Chlorobium sp.]